MIKSPEFSPNLKRAAPRALAALGFLLASCSGDDAAPAKITGSPEAMGVSPNAVYQAASDDEQPIPAVDLPKPVEISIKTEEECLNPGEGSSSALSSVFVDDRHYLVGILDGSCNVPLESTQVGLYKQAEQSSEPALAAQNGEQVLLECYSDNPGNQKIGDIRPNTNSRVWWQLIYDNPATGQNERWLIPAANLTGDDTNQSLRCE